MVASLAWMSSSLKFVGGGGRKSAAELEIDLSFYLSVRLRNPRWIDGLRAEV